MYDMVQFEKVGIVYSIQYTYSIVYNLNEFNIYIYIYMNPGIHGVYPNSILKIICFIG